MSQAYRSVSGPSRPVSIGSTTLNVGPGLDLQYLQDSNHLLDDAEALKKELERKGYLFLRGIHERNTVLCAKKAVLQHLHKLDSSLFVGDRWSEGVLATECADNPLPFMEGKNSITHSDRVLSVIEGERVKSVFGRIFGESTETFDYKWLRAMHHGGFTGAHVDNVYMSRGTDKLLTCWTPLGDVTIDMGTLAVCEGSHILPEFEYFHSTYGMVDLEKENIQGTGWFTNDPREITKRFGGVWKTTDFRAGDVLIFTMRTVHMSTVNSTYFARISCDTRWLPGSHVADSRFMAPLADVKPEFGLYGNEEKNKRTMNDMKREWGFL